MRGIPAGPGDEVSAVYVDPPPPGITTLPGHANARSTATVAILEAVDRARRERPAAPEPARRGAPAQGRRRPRRTCRWRWSRRRCSAPGRSTRPSRRWPSGWSTPATSCRARPASTCSPGGCRGCAVAGRCPASGVGPTRHLEAIEAALLATDDSYLAVQGPPGTGKTYVASRVIARLVARARLGRRASPRRDTRRSRTSCAPSSPPGCPPSRSARRPATPRAPPGPPWPRPTSSPSSPPGTCAPAGATSSAARPGTSPAPSASAAASSTSSSSTRPGSSPSRRPSPARWPVTGCCCSATPSSCRRCRRAPTPTPSTPPRSAG